MSTKSSHQCPECGSHYWDTWASQGLKECSNCGHQRKYTPKVRDYSRPSKAQEKALEKIKAYFKKRTSLEIASLTLKTINQNYHEMWFDIKTEGNVFMRDGAYGTIGRRGKIEVLGCASIYGDDKQVKHFNKMLNN
jgi:predicted  nucleic acid-binding Zn-ribbon protein